jgi:hypothetical protein
MCTFAECLISRCLAHPDFLDEPSAHRRTHEKTDLLINSFDPGVLWDDYGTRSDMMVSLSFEKSSLVLISTAAIYTQISMC